jgi:hypothetical protein
MVAIIRGESTFFGPGQTYAKFLPDGTRIAYSTVNPDFHCDVWNVPVLGGEPQMMLKNASGPFWTPHGRE